MLSDVERRTHTTDCGRVTDQNASIRIGLLEYAREDDHLVVGLHALPPMQGYR